MVLNTFLQAADERSAALQMVTKQAEMAAAACNAATAAMAAGDAEEVLAAAEAAVLLRPDWPLSWSLRAAALNELQLHADVLASVPLMQDVGAAWQHEGGRAQAALQALFQQLPALMQQTASVDHDEALQAWAQLSEADPTMLQARSAIYREYLQEATRLREAAAAAAVVDEDADDPNELASHALSCLRECAADAAAFRASEAYELPAERAGLLLLGGADGGARALGHFLKLRRPNVPLAAYGEGAVDKAEAVIELNIGMGLEFLLEKDGPQRAQAGPRGAPLHDLAEVAEQRPVRLLRGLAASAWHDARAHAVCRALEASFELIRAEGLALLQQDRRATAPGAPGAAGAPGAPGAPGGAARPFLSHRSQALAAGDWCDVGLYFNGMKNELNAARAPRTSALLGGDEGGLRRDCTSCPLGSAYFSLLRPRTRLAAHCGPTNARLRAHLGLIVPDGDCEIEVGGEARRWREGEVLLFDDSFEHAVHNETDEARLILLVDLWHPQLQTDEQRAAALQHDAQLCARYRGVAHDGVYEATTLRGH